MFDLIELDQAEAALRALSRGELPPIAREAAPVDHPKGDISRCPFHNGALAREEMIAA